MRTGGYLGLASAVLLAVLLVTGVWGWQQPFPSRRFSDEEPARPVQAGAPKTEYSFARAIYRNAGGFGWGYRGGSWATDYPKADRQFLMGVKRLSLIESGDGPVTLAWNDPRLFQYPILYAVEVGHMALDDAEAARLREYLLRGGFLVVDDFHATYEWDVFETAIRKVFPDRPIQEVDISDPVFHCFYDVNEKIQVPGVHYVWSGSTSERGGTTPHFRGIYDDKGRVMVMINFNMDLGDAWEWADLPEYPEKFSSMAYRLGINYIIYSMTH
jgi:hypothetical protein